MAAVCEACAVAVVAVVEVCDVEVWEVEEPPAPNEPAMLPRVRFPPRAVAAIAAKDKAANVRCRADLRHAHKALPFKSEPRPGTGILS